jgi:hypothetical protein
MVVVILGQGVNLQQFMRALRTERELYRTADGVK